MVKKITKYKIISMYLMDYSRRYYLREIADLLKKPHQTIKPHIELLTKEGILIKNERKNIIEYNLNFKNKKIFDYLIIAEKESLNEKLEQDAYLKILFEKLSDYFTENIFIIFGSAVTKLSKGSDIDLLMIGKKNVSKQIEDFENIYNKKIHKIQIINIKSLNLTLTKEIYKKHIIFNNTEQVVRYFGDLYEKNKLV
ncbi:MAG: nucleotidyltransferase domain-containing protein [Nanoarchaeota archaeon]